MKKASVIRRVYQGPSKPLTKMFSHKTTMFFARENPVFDGLWGPWWGSLRTPWMVLVGLEPGLEACQGTAKGWPKGAHRIGEVKGSLGHVRCPLACEVGQSDFLAMKLGPRCGVSWVCHGT